MSTLMVEKTIKITNGERAIILMDDPTLTGNVLLEERAAGAKYTRIVLSPEETKELANALISMLGADEFVLGGEVDD
jgi:hypothetical protein